MDSVSERLDKLSAALNESLSRMSVSIGCERSILTQVKGNATGIPSVYIQKLAQKYPDVNIVYLVTGEGEPLKSMELDKVQISTRRLVKNLAEVIEDAQELMEIIQPLTSRKLKLQ